MTKAGAIFICAVVFQINLMCSRPQANVFITESLCAALGVMIAR